MLRPFLMIGIGGSGGKTLRVIREDLIWRLQEAGWPMESEGFPKCWQFLSIDVAAHPDGDEPDLPQQLPVGDFLGLVRPGITYNTIDEALTQQLTPQQQLTALGGWRPEPHKVTVPISKGAGQFRALGNVVTLTRLDEIRRRIDQAVAQLSSTDADRQLKLITTKLGQGVDRPDKPEPVALVISSIAGGSGAGAVLSICDVLRAQSTGRNWLSESIGILYAPDVFDQLPDASRKGVRPNTLGAISELVAGYWMRGGGGGMSENLTSVYEAQGIGVAAMTGSGPRYPLLVGASNADVSYGKQNEIYRGMGRALSAWVTSRSLQSSMTAYFTGNWPQAAGNIQDNMGLKVLGMETPFSALGFARVSLGRDWFDRYASQRLARLAVNRLTAHHLTFRQPGDDRTDDAIIQEITDSVWPAFLSQSQVDERGIDRNQIVDALRLTAEWQELGRNWSVASTSRVLEGAPQEGLALNVWAQRIEGTILTERGQELHGQYRKHYVLRTQEWVSRIQVELAEHVAHACAVYGVAIASRLLDRLRQELWSVVNEMPAEAALFSSKAERAVQDIRVELSKIGGEKVPPRQDLLLPAVRKAAAAVYFRSEAELRSWVGELLRELLEGVVDPLETAVRHAKELLDEESSPRGSVPSEVQYWPEGDDVPLRFRPSKNEFLLDEVEAFPRVLEQLVMQSTGAATPKDALVAAVVSLIRAGDGLDESGHRVKQESAPLKTRQTWVPTLRDATSNMSAPARADYEFLIRPYDLLSRADQWINDKSRPLGRYIAMSLRDHLEEPGVSPAEAQGRIQRFSSQLKGAVDRSRPLVNINRGLLSLVHNQMEETPQTLIDPIPLPPSSEAGRKAAEVLVASKVIDEGDTAVFGDTVGQQFDIFGFLSEPYEPVVFASLMEPIASTWSKVSLDDNARQAFWQWRRSRPLADAIPAAKPVVGAMLRGWFTGLALGQVKVGDAMTGGTVDVWIPDRSGHGGSWTTFPDPLLRPVNNTADAVGAVFESLTLAMVLVYNDASLAPLAPYHRLRDLGSSGAHGGMESYESLNRELVQWLRDGITAPGSPEPVRVGSPSAGAEERHRLTEERLAAWRESYDHRFGEFRRKGALTGLPRDFELANEIIQALDELLNGVRSFADAIDSEADFV